MKALEYFCCISSDKLSVLTGCKREEFIRGYRAYVWRKKNSLGLQKQISLVSQCIPAFLSHPGIVLALMRVENKTDSILEYSCSRDGSLG